MQGFLQNLLGGGQQRQEYQDYVNRYDQGHPSQGYSNQEVADRYQQVARQLPPDVYQQSAEEAFNRMSPQERQEFGRYLQQRGQQQGMSFPDMNQDGVDDRLQDPRELARMTTRMHEQQPDMLSQLLGGKSGTALDNPMVKAAAAGIAAMAARKILTGR